MEIKKEFVKTLIALYGQHPCLYVTKLPDYHNRSKREQALETICRDFLELTKDVITPELVKTKIANLRSQYIEHLNKIQQSKKSGAATAEVYKPTWCLFEDMSFLNPHVKARAGESSMQGSAGSSTASFDDNDHSTSDLQFTEVCDALKRKRGSSSTGSTSASSISGQVLRSNKKKAAPIVAPDSRSKFWESMSHTLDAFSADEEPQDGLHHWILHLESELRRKKRSSLKSLKKSIMGIVDNEDSE